MKQSAGCRLLPLLLLLILPCHAFARVVRETLVIEEWVADFLRPTADVHRPLSSRSARKEPFDIPERQRGVKYLINGNVNPVILNKCIW